MRVQLYAKREVAEADYYGGHTVVPKIKPVESNKSKGRTYTTLISKYNQAMEEGFYGEAELIVYAFLEDRLKAFIYYSNLIDARNSRNLNENGMLIYGKEARVDNISEKISIITASLKMCNKRADEKNSFEKELSSAFRHSLNRGELNAELKKIKKWCDYRNEVVHALFNKDIEAVRTGLADHVREGYRLARYIDDQVRKLKQA